MKLKMKIVRTKLRCRTSGRTSSGNQSSAFIAAVSSAVAEQARGIVEQDRDDEDQPVGVAERARQVDRADRLGDAEDDAADDGAEQRADAAEDRPFADFQEI